MTKTTPTDASPVKKEAKARGRRGRKPAVSENVRFFVGKPVKNHEPPVFDQEVTSEAEGLVAAFKTDRCLFLVGEYIVAQRIEGGRVTLDKEPTLPSSQRVSTVNAS
jgi:hypothetical protein